MDEDKSLQGMSNGALTAMKKNAKSQIIKLQQALDSLNQSAIQHSLKERPHPAVSGSAPNMGSGFEESRAASPNPFVENSFALMRPPTPTTEERIQDARQYIGAIALMLHDFEQQRDAVVAEEQRRAEDKRRRVASTQAESAANLDVQVAKDVRRHLANARANQYDTLMAIQDSNRRHDSKVSAIRRLVEDQRAQQFSHLKDQQKKEKEREDERVAKLQAEAERRRQRNDAKEAKLAEKMSAFDKARMQALESGPRVAGHMVRQLQSTQSHAIKAQQRRLNGGADSTRGARASPSPAVPDPYSSEVLDRLLKPQPRGIGLKNELDTTLESHVEQAKRITAFTSAECKDRREMREKRHDKHFNEIYEQKEQRWATQAKRDKEEEIRIESLKQAQREQLERLTMQREEVRQHAIVRASHHCSLGKNVDHWAARARRLIESACTAALQTNDASAGSATSPFEQHRRPQKGFEENRSKSSMR